MEVREGVGGGGGGGCREGEGQLAGIRLMVVEEAGFENFRG